MQRVDNMAGRLPQLYRDGELLRGSRSTGGVLGVPGVQLELVDELAREIQRAHWFDATYELEHAARLAALLDFVPESWQELDLFRAWVHALRDSVLHTGGLTVAGIQSFVTRYTKAFESVLGVDVVMQVDTWDDAETAEDAEVNSAPALIENPKTRRFARFPEAGLLESLSQFTITNRGLHSAPVSFLIAGTPAGREYAPLIANLTTGDALIYAGEVPEGQRLWISVDDETGTVSATLETDDVTANLRSVSGLVPGTPYTSAQLASPAKPMPLLRGVNQLWFFPIALFDVRGLDRFLFSMPDTSLTQGRFETSRFDHALFHQPPVMVLYAAWDEETPAAFDVRLPAAALQSPKTAAEAIPRRDLLRTSVTQGVGILHAAGVAASVRLETFAETQPQRERLAYVMPIRLTEYGSTGADRLAEHGGSWDVTSFDDSTFR